MTTKWLTVKQKKLTAKRGTDKLWKRAGKEKLAAETESIPQYYIYKHTESGSVW